MIPEEVVEVNFNRARSLLQRGALRARRSLSRVIAPASETTDSAEMKALREENEQLRKILNVQAKNQSSAAMPDSIHMSRDADDKQVDMATEYDLELEQKLQSLKAAHGNEEFTQVAQKVIR